MTALAVPFCKIKSGTIGIFSMVRCRARTSEFPVQLEERKNADALAFVDRLN